jgi:hypothetical protein
MHNVIQFPTGGTVAPEQRAVPAEGGGQDVFSPDQAAQLTLEDGRLYGWASREGRLSAHYWPLEADLKALLGRHGAAAAAMRLGLPVPFVRGWAIELGLDRIRRIGGAPEDEAAEDAAPTAPLSPLADDAFRWSETSACA